LNENGVAHTFEVYSSPLEMDNEHGQILTLVDVTEAAKSEAALRRSEALAAVGEAAAQLAHEIKNPLGSIRLGVEMLREHATAEDAQRTITLVERGIQHLNKLSCRRHPVLAATAT
jgi:nitrogen-specific signal transduction histidine kinase